MIERTRHPARSSSRGFTLLEIMVALAVFAVLAITLYGRTGDVLTQTARLEERTFATWLAQDDLAAAQLEAEQGGDGGSGTLVSQAHFAGRDWEIERVARSTDQTGFLHLEVSVYRLTEQGRDDTPRATLSSHASVPVAP